MSAYADKRHMSAYADIVLKSAYADNRQCRRTPTSRWGCTSMRRTRIQTMHDLASVARGRRIELGLTQAELAARSGVSRDWVNSFERGKRTVDISLVFRLFDSLGIGVEAVDATSLGDPAGAGAL